MDHADNVAYSVYDFDDFYRAGLIPLASFRQGAKTSPDYDEFMDWLPKHKRSGITTEELQENEESIQHMLAVALETGLFISSVEQQAALKNLYFH